MVVIEIALIAVVTVASWLMATNICNRWKF
jgi:hypothetical protein